jgi:flagellar hook-associated protein 2
VEAGDYIFRVGEKEATLTFRGGSLKEFVDALNKRAGMPVEAALVSDTRDTQALVIAGRETGAANRLTFLGKATDLAERTGMVERAATGVRKVPLAASSVVPWEKPLGQDGYTVKDGVLTMDPGSEAKIPLSPAETLNPNMVLELLVKVQRIPQATVEEVKPPSGPAIPDTGYIEYGGIRIQSESSKTPLPEWEAPKPPEVVTDMRVLFAEGDGKLLELPPIADTTDFQRIRIPVGELAGTLGAIDVRNSNTHRKIVISDISLYDKTQRGDYRPAHPLEEAGDAELTLDGIKVTRPTNMIDDLMPGVTLSLKAPTSEPVEMSIARDVEGIKEQILTLIGTYNRFITDIDVLTRKDEKIIEDADYLTDEEKAKARENLGVLFGDLTLQQLKSTLQTAFMNPYPTSEGRDLALLAQIGISTDTRAPGGGGIDKTRLRGYLEVAEDTLTTSITQHPDAVKELFGNDTDGDLVVNAGLAYSMDTLLRPFVVTGGILPSKIGTLDQQITRKNREIADYNKYLEDYLAQLKKKYGQMESALDALEKSSQSLENFNKQNSE